MTDAEVIASRVMDGASVLLAGNRGPDLGESSVVEEVVMRIADRVKVRSISADLAAAHDLRPDERYDAVVLGGCRCMDCTIVAFTLYARHVVADGLMAVLDTNPMAAWVGWYQGHGPKTRSYGVATRMALARLELLDGVHPRWRVELDHFEQSTELGGVMILRRRF